MCGWINNNVHTIYTLLWPMLSFLFINQNKSTIKTLTYYPFFYSCFCFFFMSQLFLFFLPLIHFLPLLPYFHSPFTMFFLPTRPRTSNQHNFQWVDRKLSDSVLDQTKESCQWFQSHLHPHRGRWEPHLMFYLIFILLFYSTATSLVSSNAKL